MLMYWNKSTNIQFGIELCRNMSLWLAQWIYCVTNHFAYSLYDGLVVHSVTVLRTHKIVSYYTTTDLENGYHCNMIKMKHEIGSPLFSAIRSSNSLDFIFDVTLPIPNFFFLKEFMAGLICAFTFFVAPF